MSKREFQDNLTDMTAVPTLLAGLSNDLAAEVLASSASTAYELSHTIDRALAREASMANRDELMGVLSGNVESISNKLAQHNNSERLRLLRQKAASGKDNIEFFLLDLNARIADLRERSEQWGSQIDALQKVLDDIESGQSPELTPDGKLADPEAEAAVQKYEEAYGHKVDRTDAAQLKKVLEFAEDQKRQTDNTIDDLETVRDRAQQLRAEGADTPEQVVQLRQDVETLEEELALNLVVATSESAAVKQASVEAVADDAASRSFADDGLSAESETFFTMGEDNPFEKGDLGSAFGMASIEPENSPSFEENENVPTRFAALDDPSRGLG